MKKLNLCLTFCMTSCMAVLGQGEATHDLSYYIRQAHEYSPLIKDYQKRTEADEAHLQQLRSLYTRSTVEANGEWLFVPVVERAGGGHAFRWNAQDGTDYWGYDLGESSGHLHAGVTWSQPLLGRSTLRVAQEQHAASAESNSHLARMEKHQLERTVTEQYLLCLQDQIDRQYADSISRLLEEQKVVVERLVQNGLLKTSDLRLLNIEREAQDERATAARQAYKTHLSELHLLCGMQDEGEGELPLVQLEMQTWQEGESLFARQFMLDSLQEHLALKAFRQQYKPRLNLFANGGLQTSMPRQWYRHFGVSAGLTLAWTLYDGHQMKWQRRQTEARLSTLDTYRTHAEYQRRMRMEQCLEQMRGYDERARALEGQIAEYGHVLDTYMKEIKAGQVSVLDYLTVLRNRTEAEHQHRLLLTNRLLVIAAYNYWNWKE